LIAELFNVAYKAISYKEAFLCVRVLAFLVLWKLQGHCIQVKGKNICFVLNYFAPLCVDFNLPTICDWGFCIQRCTRSAASAAFEIEDRVDVVGGE
jgi:hypothetical protein